MTAGCELQKAGLRSGHGQTDSEKRPIDLEDECADQGGPGIVRNFRNAHVDGRAEPEIRKDFKTVDHSVLLRENRDLLDFAHQIFLRAWVCAVKSAQYLLHWRFLVLGKNDLNGRIVVAPGGKCTSFLHWSPEHNLEDGGNSFEEVRRYLDLVPTWTNH